MLIFVLKAMSYTIGNTSLQPCWGTWDTNDLWVWHSHLAGPRWGRSDHWVLQAQSLPQCPLHQFCLHRQHQLSDKAMNIKADLAAHCTIRYDNIIGNDDVWCVGKTWMVCGSHLTILRWLSIGSLTFCVLALHVVLGSHSYVSSLLSVWGPLQSHQHMLWSVAYIGRGDSFSSPSPTWW